jgi:GntR family transcriptional regulator
MRRRGLTPSSKVLVATIALASKVTAEKLEIEAGEELVYLKRLRLANYEPMCVEEACLPHRYCPGLIDSHDFSVSSLWDALVNDYGIRLVKARQTITAQIATRELSEHLQLPAKDPILHIERTSYSQLAKPVVYVRIHYRGDRYSLVHALNR